MANANLPQNKVNPLYGDPNYRKVIELLTEHKGINEDFLAALKEDRDRKFKEEEAKIKKIRDKHKRKKEAV